MDPKHFTEIVGSNLERASVCSTGCSINQLGIQRTYEPTRDSYKISSWRQCLLELASENRRCVNPSQ